MMLKKKESNREAQKIFIASKIAHKTNRRKIFSYLLIYKDFS